MQNILRHDNIVVLYGRREELEMISMLGIKCHMIQRGRLHKIHFIVIYIWIELAYDENGNINVS